MTAHSSIVRSVTKMGNRAERMREQAERLESEADSLMTHGGDIAYWTTPATPNTAFSKRRDKAMKDGLRGVAKLQYADMLRCQAASLDSIPDSGDLERGSRVVGDFGSGTIKRINTNSFTVDFDSIGCLKVAKRSVRLTE